MPTEAHTSPRLLASEREDDEIAPVHDLAAVDEVAKVDDRLVVRLEPSIIFAGDALAA